MQWSAVLKTGEQYNKRAAVLLGFATRRAAFSRAERFLRGSSNHQGQVRKEMANNDRSDAILG